MSRPVFGVVMLSALAWVEGCGPSANNSPSSFQEVKDPDLAAAPPPQMLHVTDDPKTILGRIIDAYGGKDNLPKWNKRKVRYRMKVEKAGFGAVDGIVEDTFDLPGRFKRFVPPDQGPAGRSMSMTLVLDGDKGWVVEGGRTKPLPPSRTNKRGRHDFAMMCDIQAMARDGVEASVLGEEEVEGRPAVVLSILCPPAAAFKASFDKTTGFLLKTAKSGLEREAGDKTEAILYLNDYRQVGKTFIPMRFKGAAPGIGSLDTTLLSVEFPQTIDDSEFAEP